MGLHNQLIRLELCTETFFFVQNNLSFYNMSDIREDVVDAAISRAYALMDFDIHDDIHKQDEFKKQVILADESLTENEKFEVIKELTKIHDQAKLLLNEGTKKNL
jgi:hypothetical protein